MVASRKVLLVFVTLVVAFGAYWTTSLQYLRVTDIKSVLGEISQEFNRECDKPGQWDVKFIPNKGTDEVIEDIDEHTPGGIKSVKTVLVLGKIGKLVEEYPIGTACCTKHTTVHVLVPAEYNHQRGVLDVYCTRSELTCNVLPKVEINSQ